MTTQWRCTLKLFGISICINVVLFTVLAMVFEAWISIIEKTFVKSQGKVEMSFCRNLAISIGGFFFFPLLNAIMVPWLPNYTNYDWFLALGAGIIITSLMYVFWWKEGKGNKGHIIYWDKSQALYCSEDVTSAGWVHAFYMVVQIAILTMYIIYPMERKLVIIIGALFAIYVIIVALQARYIQGNFKWSLPVVMMALVVAITYIKY